MNLLLLHLEQHRDFPGAVPKCPESELIWKLLGLIDQYYCSQHNEGFYRNQLGTTYYYLNSRCRYYLGKSVNTLISERLFKESCLLLSSTMMSVKTIAYELGFSDPSNFVRFFKRISGTNPARFRRFVLPS